MKNIILTGTPVSLPEHMRQLSIHDAPLDVVVYMPFDNLYVDDNYGLWVSPDDGFYDLEDIEDEEEDFVAVTRHEEGFEIWVSILDQFTVDRTANFEKFLPVIRLNLADEED
jgi:hypothetical protein